MVATPLPLLLLLLTQHTPERRCAHTLHTTAMPQPPPNKQRCDCVCCLELVQPCSSSVYLRAWCTLACSLFDLGQRVVESGIYWQFSHVGHFVPINLSRSQDTLTLHTTCTFASLYTAATRQTDYRQSFTMADAACASSLRLLKLMPFKDINANVYYLRY